MSEQNSATGTVGIGRWTLLTVIGVIVGIVLAAGMGWLTTSTISGSSYADQPTLEQVVSILVTFLFGLAFGVGIGALQGGSIRHHFNEIGITAWILRTAVGMGLLTVMIWKVDLLIDTSGTINLEYFDLPAVLGAGAAVGLVYGLVQWTALKRVSGTAWIWIPMTAIAWGLSFAISYSALVFAVKEELVEAIFVVDPSPENSAGPLAIFIIVIGLVLGLVSGTALRIIRRSPQSTSETP